MIHPPIPYVLVGLSDADQNVARNLKWNSTGEYSTFDFGWIVFQYVHKFQVAFTIMF